MLATPGETIFIVNLSNEGIGPAIIRSVDIRLPEGLGGGTFDEWSPAVEALRERGASVTSYWNFAEGEALGVQQRQELLHASVERSEGAGGLLEQLAGIQVVVTYASVHGDVRQARLN